MTKKMTIQEQIACNNCLISLLMLDAALADVHGSGGVQRMIREFTQEFIGSHYNTEHISDRWDSIKELLMELKIPTEGRADIAGCAVEETIQTLLLVHAV